MGGVFVKQPFSILYFFQWVKAKVLGALLTRKQKRILFLTRVYINARKRQVTNVMDLLKEESLYECMDNVQNKSVFDLPFRLYEAMWADDPEANPQTVEDQEAFEKECEHIFRQMPEWMLYGRRSDRMDDIWKIYSRVNGITIAE